MTNHLEHTQKTKELIDGLKTVCSNYGLANTGYEYKIITEVYPQKVKRGCRYAANGNGYHEIIGGRDD